MRKPRPFYREENFLFKRGGSTNPRPGSYIGVDVGRGDMADAIAFTFLNQPPRKPKKSYTEKCNAILAGPEKPTIAGEIKRQLRLEWGKHSTLPTHLILDSRSAAILVEEIVELQTSDYSIRPFFHDARKIHKFMGLYVVTIESPQSVLYFGRSK